MQEFTKARVSLFGWYVLISILLLLAFTLVAFHAEKQAFAQVDQLLQNRIQRPVVSAILEDRLYQFSTSFRERLLYFDIILFLISAASSWFLSGITLKPIKNILEKQQEFSADASHELRTPITTIIMELEALRRVKNKNPQDINNSINVISEEAIRMKHLVNNLLNLVRSDHGAQKSYIGFDVCDLADEVSQSMQKQAQKKEITLVSQHDLPIKIFGDKEAIYEAIAILIDNAIKFTAKGSVNVSTTVVKRHCHIKVTDTGIGIHDNDLSHIFDRFYRTHSRANSHGSGLGLSIASKIIKEHNGEITVKSKLDQGSTFTISLPIAS